MMIALAIATQIPVQAWADLGDEAIATAIEILHERNREIEKKTRR